MPAENEPLFCLRVRYVETGRLRYLSHLELLRAVERAVRRAGLPYAVTQGFSPRMKAAYGPALPVGVASRDEWFDLWLRAYRPAGEYLAALRRAAPPDLEPQEAAYVEVHGPSLSAVLTLSSWEVELGPQPGAAGTPFSRLRPADVEAAFAAVLARGEISYLRDGKPRTVALAGKVARGPEVSPLSGGAPGAFARFTTRSSNAGALRPDVLMGAVAVQLAESCAARSEAPLCGGVSVVSCKHCLRTSVVRAAQYLEGKDGSWVRPI